MTLNHILIP